MDLRSIEKVDCHLKTALVRLDLNLPTHNGLVLDTTRILEIVPSIRYLQAKQAKIILISHRGRPSGAYDAESSLAPFVPLIEEILGERISFNPEDPTNLPANLAECLQPSGVLLLENLRFFKGEESNDIDFARHLAKFADLYVNEAFSCSHRKHASIDKICDFLPSYAGLTLIQEVEILKNLFQPDRTPIIAIIGGKKVSTKLKVLKNLLPKIDHLFIAGGMATTFLKAGGAQIGRSFYEKDLLSEARALLSENQGKILLPKDVMSQADPSPNTLQMLQIYKTADISSQANIFDIGPESVLYLCRVLQKAKTVIWNGPLGMFENPLFDNSTKFIARYIATLTQRQQIISVAGGGDTVAALNISGVASYFSHTSTAGGAFLEWLEGCLLPGLKALEKNALHFH